MKQYIDNLVSFILVFIYLKRIWIKQLMTFLNIFFNSFYNLPIENSYGLGKIIIFGTLRLQNF